MQSKTLISILTASLLHLNASSQDMNTVNIEVTKLSETVYMFQGSGGNIGISIGKDGVYLIDSQFANLTSKITAEIKKITPKPIKLLVNTHHHGDHTGGNENLSALGTYIVAHDNVRSNLQGKSEQTLPVITFNDKLTLHLNGEKTLLYHVENAHTNGDTVVYFTESNVLHTGDTYFKGWYPFIDLNDGGSVDGYIAAVKQAMILIDDDTKIIPGHGGLSNKKEYMAFLTMMEDLRNIILEEIRKGQTEDEVANNSNLTRSYDDQGYAWQFITSEKIRRVFYKSLSQRL